MQPAFRHIGSRCKQIALATTPRQSPVVCAKGRSSGGGSSSGSGKTKQRERKGGGDKAPARSISKTLQMAEYRADEVLLFDPVPADRDALQVGGRAGGDSTGAVKQREPG